MFKIKYISAGILVPLLSTIISCQDNTVSLPEQNQLQLDEKGLATVSIDIFTEAYSETRAEEDPTMSFISSGSLIDKLIYAIYKKDGSGNFELQSYFANNSGVLEPEAVGEGQLVDNSFKAGETKNILLKIDPEETYKIVCWAQNSATAVYDTSNLANVTVDYTGAVNNDERRDAFCGSKEFTGSDKKIVVILRRPFAQINVGTTGADYDNISKIPGGAHYKFSKAVFKNVADQINVLTGEITQSDKIKNSTVTFDWAALPAWYNISGYSPKEVPVLDKAGETDVFVEAKGEEFLLVDLNKDGVIKGYLTQYNTIDQNESGDITFLSETFKYLSMSYVLVASSVSDPSEDGKGGINNGAIVDSFAVSFSDMKDGNSTTSSNSYLELHNLPAAQNWRTNILGGFYKKPSDSGVNDPNNPGGNNPEDPSDPNNPGGGPFEDPTSVFGSTHIDVLVVTNYFGNSNSTTEDRQEWFTSQNPYNPSDEDVKTEH